MSTPHGGDRRVHVSGDVTGNIQTGDHARARFIQHGAPPGGAEEPPEVRRLRQAVADLRERLDALSPGELPAPAAEVAAGALDEVDDALPADGEPALGRVRRAVFAVSGALASVAALTEAVRSLRDAAAPWF
ncbi:hypothetical protein AF335_20355 [Streptomyces eurocidicus]|uniref:Uncharacterized protein n=1 Tax=Streptomyces eurocidicus TaxID=66423 RepID=A0A2N8NTL7_STREU|nr:DUF5955 family protein [Streptomyces eurocidicus]MBB5122929.1 hypothetical protein [Streptomyces eurocidicus]MBF6056508.1 hypothetical protein [Streptomyces eurocidicus]PNE32097.1 hypothetical protein AF335_20355 [Streptomyces eurocidicus]